MSFPVALQSAVFYFLACTPCAKVRHRHKARQKAKKEREEKARFEAEQPDLYRHPDPFNTNPYWSEEIMMGPSLPKKGRGGDGHSKNPSQQRLTSSQGQDGSARATWSSSAASTGGAGSETNVPVYAVPGRPEMRPPGSSPVTAGEDDTASTKSSNKAPPLEKADDWNRTRYQREDEELWGHELAQTGHKLMNAIKHASTSAGKYVEARLGIDKSVTEEDRSNFYIAPRNPPVNDYHPPVVSSKPAHKDGHHWMLQPPPPAKVMEGKIPVSRSGSQMSVGSRRTATSVDGSGLGRIVGEKAVEAKIRNGIVPDDGEHLTVATPSRPGSRRTATGSTTKIPRARPPRSRSLSASAESEDSMDGLSQRSKRRSRRVVVTTPEFSDEEEEDEYISKSLESLSNANFAPIGKSQRRPKLPTIVGSDPNDVRDPASPRGEKGISSTPLREVANTSPESESSNSLKGRLTGLSIDSGLALQT